MAYIHVLLVHLSFCQFAIQLGSQSMKCTLSQLLNHLVSPISNSQSVSQPTSHLARHSITPVGRPPARQPTQSLIALTHSHSLTHSLTHIPRHDETCFSHFQGQQGHPTVHFGGYLFGMLIKKTASEIRP